MNTQAKEGLKNKVLNTVFAYEEGEMSRKEWLKYHKNNGTILNGSELTLKDNSFYNLNQTEIEYFKALPEAYIAPEHWSVNIYGCVLESDTKADLNKQIIAYCRSKFKDNPETDNELLDGIYEEFLVTNIQEKKTTIL